MTTVQISVPDIGDVDSVEVIEILVSVGDRVEVDDSLITVESDKASMEIPAASAGVVESLSVSIGSKVKTGDVIGQLNTASATSVETDNGDSSPAAATSSEATADKTATAERTATSSDVGADNNPVPVLVPDIGEVDSVQVIEVLVQSGEQVTIEQSLVTVESDKASMEIPAPFGGTIDTVNVAVGDTISEGSELLQLIPETTGGSSDAADPAPATDPAATASQPDAAATLQQQAPAKAATASSNAPRANSPTAHMDSGQKKRVHASPGVRRYAREHGADLQMVNGSGRKQRILKEDVTAFIKQAMEGTGPNFASGAAGGGVGIPPVPDIDFSQFGEIERVPTGRINRISARNLHRAWLNVPMVTHHDEADITEMEEFRKALKKEAREGDPRITGLAFHMKALVQTLKAYPKLNSSPTADGEALIYKHYYHIGIAVATSNGLVVPVFKDVDRKTISELAEEMTDISQRARDKKLKPDEMQGACMTISNLGGLGGTAFTPIVNTPEVAIMGLARARMQPVWNGSEFIPRLMCPVDLTYDHRVVDGADAAQFVAHYCKTIGDVRRLLI